MQYRKGNSGLTPKAYAKVQGQTVTAEYPEACDLWSPLLLAAADRLQLQKSRYIMVLRWC